MMASNAEILESKAMRMLLTTVRNKATTQRAYVAAADRLCAMLAEEALARLPDAKVDVTVETPCGTMTTGTVKAVPDDDVCPPRATMRAVRVNARRTYAHG